MSTTNTFPFSVGQQKAFISADLHSTLLFQFLFGVYTGLFPATIYLYSAIYIVHKENRTRAKDRIIIGSTTALYFVTALNAVTNWLYTNILFGTHGATRVDMFIETEIQDAPLGVTIMEDLTIFAAFLFADGLLVWRCFHACGRSFRRSLLPIALLIAETVLVLTAMVYSFLIYAKPNFETDQTDEIANHLSAAAYVTAAATSLLSTVMICLQIWRHTSHSPHSRKHYKTIVKALIESSALYTVILLLQAILDFATTGSIETSFTVLLILNYVAGAGPIISGLAPTLMIARLFVSSGQEDAEVSSPCLPSDVISRASLATNANMTHVADNLDMRQRGSIGVGEQESGEIQVIRRNEYELEDGLMSAPEAGMVCTVPT